MYTIQIYYQNTLLATENYKTLPDENSQTPITIVTGGDNGNSQLALSMITNSAKYNPDVIMVGGDLAYDNALCSCAYTWDHYLDQFEALNSKVGRLVPLVFAAGNHDVGLDSGAH